MFQLYRYMKPIGTLALLAILTGCGPSDGFSGGRGSVSGTITFDGKPIPQGSQVLFMGSEKSYMASAVVGAEGKYSLKYKGSSSLPAVLYKVQITPPSPASGQKVPATATDPAKITSTTASVEKSNSSAPFPEKYGSTASSKLEFLVEANKNNTADFKLVK